MVDKLKSLFSNTAMFIGSTIVALVIFIAYLLNKVIDLKALVSALSARKKIDSLLEERKELDEKANKDEIDYIKSRDEYLRNKDKSGK